MSIEPIRQIDIDYIFKGLEENLNKIENSDSPSVSAASQKVIVRILTRSPIRTARILLYLYKKLQDNTGSEEK